jgi:hypothetical protein
MKNINSLLKICLAVLAVAGCTPVKFYTNSSLTVNSGLKYYAVKPYLQVEKESESGRITKASVLYLPDLINPQYLVVKGPGAKKVDLKLTDGTLTSFGFSSEDALSGTIEALTGLISKGSEAIKDLSTMRSFPPAEKAAVYVELYEVLMTSEGTTLKKVEFR